MASSWESYYLVLLSGLLSLVLPAFLALVSWLGFRRRYKPQSLAINQTKLGQKINVRFFLATNAALILFTLALELVPCVTTLQGASAHGGIKNLIGIVSVAGFAVLGLLYAVRKGDMSWVDSFSSKEKNNEH